MATAVGGGRLLEGRVWSCSNGLWTRGIGQERVAGTERCVWVLSSVRCECALYGCRRQARSGMGVASYQTGRQTSKQVDTQQLERQADGRQAK